MENEKEDKESLKKDEVMSEHSISQISLDTVKEEKIEVKKDDKQ